MLLYHSLTFSPSSSLSPSFSPTTTPSLSVFLDCFLPPSLCLHCRLIVRTLQEEAVFHLRTQPLLLTKTSIVFLVLQDRLQVLPSLPLLPAALLTDSTRSIVQTLVIVSLKNRPIFPLRLQCHLLAKTTCTVFLNLSVMGVTCIVLRVHRDRQVQRSYRIPRHRRNSYIQCTFFKTSSRRGNITTPGYGKTPSR